MLRVVSLDSYWACQSQQRAWWRGRLIDWNGLTDLRDCTFVPQIFTVWICRLILVPNSAIKQSEFEWLLEVQLCPQNRASFKATGWLMDSEFEYLQEQAPINALRTHPSI